MYNRKRIYISFAASAVILLLLSLTGCSDKGLDGLLDPLFHGGGGSNSSSFQQVNLVSDTMGFNGTRIDPNLVNAWGIAVSPTGVFWISANHTGKSVVYDESGSQKLSPVTIPTVNNAPGGAPTGVVFNNTQDFKLPGSNTPSRLIFAGEDGIISAWGQTSGSMAVVAADQSAQNAVYKGIDIAEYNGSKYIYAANFKQSKVDVFDKDFKPVTNITFSDPGIPSDYGPFNIKNIAGQLFVTFAKHLGPDNMDDEKGPGNGYVDIFTPGGHLIKRFISRGNLNSPWAIAAVPFGRFAGSILVGNFGDGHINIYNLLGISLGQLKDKNGKAITIDGLWALYPFNNNIYFSAGPDDENHGLFGYLQAK